MGLKWLKIVKNAQMGVIGLAEVKHSHSHLRVKTTIYTTLQAGEPVCHPAACKLTTLESLSIFHDPVYKKPGVFFLWRRYLAKNRPFFRPKGPNPA